MIFVTLGTQDKSFERLLREIDKLIEKKVIKSEVVVQAGQTKYFSKNMKIFDFVDMSQFNKYIQNCEFLITHAGVGSIISGLKAQKSVIAVARLSEYGEHENNHQIEITNKFVELGYIVGCLSVDELEEGILNLSEFKAKNYLSNNQKFCDLIENLIND
ncbi:MAG: PssE/Cps14G family polysaccharide biosynthesis glycosyltransferase [Erysipelotrichaceae bacterium]